MNKNLDHLICLQLLGSFNRWKFKGLITEIKVCDSKMKQKDAWRYLGQGCLPYPWQWWDPYLCFSFLLVNIAFMSPILEKMINPAKAE